ncbi:MAG: phosphomannomutase/phosphoglucomutase [Gammaproteobacteria bacterium]|nr:phosphomannomutase/phosphoglucomutase [Gammaproteobacteria bacterium]
MDCRVPAPLFKAYDIRGVAGEGDGALSGALVHRSGRAFGSRARRSGCGTVAVARDGRLSGAALGRALVDGISASGCNVVDIGQAATPLLYFAAHRLAGGCGVMLTGSHNPPEYNGLKLMLAGETLHGGAIQTLRDDCERGEFTAGDGAVRRMDVRGDYISCVTESVSIARKFDIVVDCGNGVAGNTAPALFRALGLGVRELFCEVDGNFPNHHPDPSRPENMRHLGRAVCESGADFGIAFDGDGDRLGVAAADGAIVWPDRQMVLFAREVLAENPGAKIIYDVKCSQVLPRAITAAGGRPEMWKTGHSLLKARLRETGAPFAGEMSGHFFFADRWFGFDDALYAGARLCQLLAKSDRSPAQIFRALPDTANTPEIHIPMAEGRQHALAEKLAQNANFPGAEISVIDGLRVDFTDGFALARASNTTPVLILRFEGENEKSLRRIQARFKEYILSVAPEVKVKF